MIWRADSSASAITSIVISFIQAVEAPPARRVVIVVGRVCVIYGTFPPCSTPTDGWMDGLLSTLYYCSTPVCLLLLLIHHRRRHRQFNQRVRHYFCFSTTVDPPQKGVGGQRGASLPSTYTHPLKHSRMQYCAARRFSRRRRFRP